MECAQQQARRGGQDQRHQDADDQAPCHVDAGQVTRGRRRRTGRDGELDPKPYHGAECRPHL